MRLWTVVLALGLAVLLVAPVTRADDGWEDGERQTGTDVRSDGFSITSDRVQGTEHDRIEFNLDASNIEIRFDLYGNASTSESEAGVRIGLQRVIEFRDANGDGAFQSSDEVRAEYQPSDFVLANITATNLTSNGVPGVQVTASYTFRDAPNATFGIRATTFEGPTTFEDLALQPVQTKIDILFGAFPYRDSDTLPAVQLGLSSEVEGVSPVPDPSGVGFSTGSLNASFGWKSFAVVDGVEQPVHVSVTQSEGAGNESEATVAFAYARGSVIVHDPTVGFAQLATVSLPSVLGNPLFYLVGVVAAVGVFGAFAATRTGRKPKGS